MNKLTITILLSLILPMQVFAQSASPETVYRERVEQARADYRVAIAKRIREAKVVEVFLLKFDDVREADAIEDDEQRFPVSPYEATTSAISQRKLSSAEMKPLLSELADQIALPKHKGGAFCHFPIHGLRIYSDEPNGEPWGKKLVYSGTFCWECGNFGFEYPDGAQWLDTNSKLKETFNQLLPIPESEVERFKNGEALGPNFGEPPDTEKTSKSQAKESK